MFSHLDSKKSTLSKTVNHHALPDGLAKSILGEGLFFLSLKNWQQQMFRIKLAGKNSLTDKIDG